MIVKNKILIGILVLFSLGNWMISCKTTQSPRDEAIENMKEIKDKRTAKKVVEERNSLSLQTDSVTFEPSFEHADYIEFEQCQLSDGNCLNYILTKEEGKIEYFPKDEQTKARSCKKSDSESDDQGYLCGAWIQLKSIFGKESDGSTDQIKIGSSLGLPVAGIAAAGLTTALVIVAVQQVNKRAEISYIISKGGQDFKLRFTLPGFPEPSPGLVTDSKIFLKSLEDRGYTIKETKLAINEKSDLNIHLESRGRVDNAAANWMMVNQEFFDHKNTKGIDSFMCRHPDCTALVQSKLGKSADIQTIKFSSNVKGKVDDLDFGKFFHPAGKSPFKNTSALVETWLKNPDLPKLVVTCYNVVPVWGCLWELRKRGLLSKAQNAPNIELHTSRLSNDDFGKVSKIGNVIMPSQAEGYGHSINEARGKGQIVLTLDAEPMGGLVKDGVDGYKIGSKQVGQFGSGAPQYGFDQDELAAKVRQMSKLSEIERGAITTNARKSFEADRSAFFKQFGDKTDALMQKRLQERSLNIGEDLEIKKGWDAKKIVGIVGVGVAVSAAVAIGWSQLRAKDDLSENDSLRLANNNSESNDYRLGYCLFSDIQSGQNLICKEFSFNAFYESELKESCLSSALVSSDLEKVKWGVDSNCPKVGVRESCVVKSVVSWLQSDIQVHMYDKLNSRVLVCQ